MSDDGTYRAASGLIGLEAAEATLTRAVQSGRLHQSWLLAGPKGIGKATLARRLATGLLSDALSDGGGTASSPVGRLPNPQDSADGRLVMSGGHPDLREIATEIDSKTGRMKTGIGIDAIRGIGRFMRMTASRGGRRVAIVDGAEDMTLNAANALLKVLEEPPRGGVLILVSHAPGRLPPTIRSRCCMLSMPALADSIIDRILTTHRPGLAVADRAVLARMAGGSVGRAFALADGDGIGLLRCVLDVLADQFRPGGGLAVHALADRLARRGSEAAFDMATGLLCWWLGGLAGQLVAAHGRIGAVRLFESDGEMAQSDRKATAVLAALGPDRLARLWSRVDAHLDSQGRANLDRKQAILTVFSLIRSA